MKNIKITEDYAIYFSQKYSDGLYKNFLNNLIAYKYNISMLNDILHDMLLKIKIQVIPNFRWDFQGRLWVALSIILEN